MDRFKIGIIIVDEQISFAHRNLSAAVESLKALGCVEQDIAVRHAPKLFGVTAVTQIFAEYTDVDAVAVLAENDGSPEYAAMLYGVTKLQISWNMPVTIGDCTAAADAVEMVSTQNEMEAAAPESAAPDKKSIN